MWLYAASLVLGIGLYYVPELVVLYDLPVAVEGYAWKGASVLVLLGIWWSIYRRRADVLVVVLALYVFVPETITFKRTCDDQYWKCRAVNESTHTLLFERTLPLLFCNASSEGPQALASLLVIQLLDKKEFDRFLGDSYCGTPIQLAIFETTVTHLFEVSCTMLPACRERLFFGHTVNMLKAVNRFEKCLDQPCSNNCILQYESYWNQLERIKLLTENEQAKNTVDFLLAQEQDYNKRCFQACCTPGWLV